MKKIILVFLILCLICLCFVGCNNFNNQHDTIVIYGRTNLKFDNITIETKDGYFYNNHEKFTVNENTIGITIYFSKDEEDIWDSPQE